MTPRRKEDFDDDEASGTEKTSVCQQPEKPSSFSVDLPDRPFQQRTDLFSCHAWLTPFAYFKKLRLSATQHNTTRLQKLLRNVNNSNLEAFVLL